MKPLQSMRRETRTFTHVFYVPGTTQPIDLVDPSTQRGGYSKETLDEIRLRHPDAIMIPCWDAMVKMEEARKEKYNAPPVEINGDRYWEMLGELPPMNHRAGKGSSSFMMEEYKEGRYTRIFARIGDKFYEMVGTDSLTHDEIIARIQASLKS